MFYKNVIPPLEKGVYLILKSLIGIKEFKTVIKANALL